MHKDGKQNHEIALRLNRTDNSITMQKTFLIKEGRLVHQNKTHLYGKDKIKPLETKYDNTPFTAYEAAKFVRFFDQGLTVEEIAKEILELKDKEELSELDQKVTDEMQSNLKEINEYIQDLKSQ